MRTLIIFFLFLTLQMDSIKLKIQEEFTQLQMIFNGFSKGQFNEKVKFLLWLALHQALPTNSLRHARGLATSALCPICNLHEDTVLHCLRD
ncbi:hypothetical protein HN51_000594 [Arachis hypogaea]